MERGILPLGCVRSGQDVVVVGLEGNLRGRLAELGFLENKSLRVLQNVGGLVMVALGSERLALDREVAMDILVCVIT